MLSICSWYSASTVRSIGFSALSTRDFGLRFSERIGRLSNLQKLGKVADNETISKLQSYRDELVRNAGPDGPVNLDLKQLSDLRSQFRMDV